MSDVNQKSAIEQEHDDLTAEREQLTAEIAQMDSDRKEKVARLAEIARRMKAADAYMRALNDTPIASRRRGITDHVLSALREAPDGIGRADLIEKLGVADDKAAASSVSNALSRLKLTGDAENRDGKWYAPAKEMAEAA